MVLSGHPQSGFGGGQHGLGGGQHGLGGGQHGTGLGLHLVGAAEKALITGAARHLKTACVVPEANKNIFITVILLISIYKKFLHDDSVLAAKLNKNF